ncbi:diguanylate cyclase [Spongiactinospora gelatinilytica]|uniref:Diguanylate cyclase n=1 Tax=Spongiactinospora gelatinilytica TaxID=2666298 RepID=A0A2W2H9S5_9ACTN|nr:membrane dipeptidase [Spongiactinospora gelatinilytica]PZG42987.1 diguanylate cyclase [Spongiactinospora gelatinilytica]
MLEPAKRYTGYRSYDYLEPGSDYRVFDLAPELGRVPAYEGVPLSGEQKDRVRRLLTDNVVVSLHDHPSVFPTDIAQTVEYNRTARHHTGYAGLARSGMTAVFDNLMDGTCCITSPAGWKWTDVVADIGMRLSDLAHQDYVIKVERLDDIRAAHETGRIGLVLALEAATMIENEVDRIDMLYGFGVRQMGIAYSEANTLGSGLRERNDGGLTIFGEKAVRRMNKLGIAIDVSHSGDRTSLDTIRHSDKPILITHAGARSVWPTNRMKPDEVIKAAAERGGVIGLEAAPHTTLSPDHPRHSLESVMDHFTYCVDLVGIDHVAFGPDTLFGDHVGLHDTFAEHLSIKQAHGSASYEKVPYVDGLENPAECFWNIIAWLVRNGYSDDEITKVVGGNVLRVLEEVWY